MFRSGRQILLRTGLFGFRRVRLFFWVVAFWVGFLWIIRVCAGVDGDGRIWNGRVQEFPGFFVFLQAHLSRLAVGVEAEHGLGGADFYRDDVPEVEGDYVGGDEVDVALGVDGASVADGVGGAGFVGAGAGGLGSFDLDAEKGDVGFRGRAQHEMSYVPGT